MVIHVRDWFQTSEKPGHSRHEDYEESVHSHHPGESRLKPVDDLQKQTRRFTIDPRQFLRSLRKHKGHSQVPIHLEATTVTAVREQAKRDPLTLLHHLTEHLTDCLAAVQATILAVVAELDELREQSQQVQNHIRTLAEIAQKLQHERDQSDALRVHQEAQLISDIYRDAMECTTVALTITREINQRRREVKGDSGGLGGKNNGGSGTSTDQNADQDRPLLDQGPSGEGRCFRCKQFGHCSLYCPFLQGSARLTSTQSPSEVQEVTDATQENSES